jgi:hypothetical protein
VPKVAYAKKKLGTVKLDIVRHINRIVESYREMGYKLSLRQVYYRFVAEDLFPADWVDPETGSKNSQKNYGKLGDILGDARMTGLVDWNAIEDRTRELSAVPHWETPATIIETCARSFRLDKWDTQPYRIECWVEKDALEGIVTQAAHAQDVAAFSCRGYGSLSSLWEAAQRLKAYVKTGQRPVILHLGDHDPSGIDMTRDIEERLNTFVEQDWLNEVMGPKLRKAGKPGSVTRGDIWKSIGDFIKEKYPEPHGPGGFVPPSLKPITIRRIALNMDQVEEYNPPPNPAKSTDSRFKKYVEEHGNESWELDALEPAVLDALITDTIDEYRRPEPYTVRETQEQTDRADLAKAAKHWNGDLAPAIAALK